MPTSKLPSVSELALLPHRAQVAFAARCARRVFSRSEHVFPAARTRAEAMRLLNWVEEIGMLGVAPPNPELRSIEALWSGIEAANHIKCLLTAKYAAEAIIQGPSSEITNFVVEAMNACAQSLKSSEENVVELIFTDYLTLFGYVSDRQPVFRGENIRPTAAVSMSPLEVLDPKLFGPLWPDGPQKNDVASDGGGDESVGIVLEIEVPEETDDVDVVAQVSGLLEDVNRLHRALGGHGVKILKLDVESEVSVAGVPQ